jgi:hypothetical protein
MRPKTGTHVSKLFTEELLDASLISRPMSAMTICSRRSACRLATDSFRS